MIFVILGTQDKGFVRLLEEIDRLINDGVISDSVIAQIGHTKYYSENMKLMDFIGIDQFNDYIKSADLIITHGGVGAILNALLQHKKVIAVPRRAEFNEHENDHQIEIVQEFKNYGYIQGTLSVNGLKEEIMKNNEFTPKPYKANNQFFCDQLAEIIERI